MCTMCFAAVIETGCGFSNPTITVLATVLETGDAPNTVPAVPTATMSVGDEFLGILTRGDRDLVAVTLVADQVYQIDLSGSGASPVTDTFLRVLDASGNVVAFNDDAVALNSRVTFSPSVRGAYFLSAGSYNDGFAGTYRMAITEIAAPHLPPNGTLDQLADFLTDGY